MKNFKVGKEIKQILCNSKDVTDLIDNKVFPIVANEGTNFPFAVYRRNGYRPASNKDYEDEVVSLEIVILSLKYDESVEIANTIADTLISNKTDIIEDIQISNISEDYTEDTFIQRLYIDIYLK